MAQYISKDALVAEIERLMTPECGYSMNKLLDFIDTLEVKDPYEQTIQYSSIEDGIKAHAEVYSFNIESKLFNQLTKEQQVLWRKEIEQACISGGDAGVELARDPRYKENLEEKEVDLEKELVSFAYTLPHSAIGDGEHLGKFNDPKVKEARKHGWSHLWRYNYVKEIAKHFFELGLKAQKENNYIIR